MKKLTQVLVFSKSSPGLFVLQGEGLLKVGSESSMGRTRRVPLITSSWSPYVNSLSKSSDVEPGAPAVVWPPKASVLMVTSP